MPFGEPLPSRFPVGETRMSRSAEPGERCALRRNHRLMAGARLVAIPGIGWACEPCATANASPLTRGPL